MYPLLVAGDPEREKEWNNAHKGSRIQPRTRNLEQARILVLWKYWCQDNGHDLCHLIISHAQADMAALSQVKIGNTIVINQQNTFISETQRPRRDPDPNPLGSSSGALSGTTTRVMFESLILLRALQLHRSFCYLDFHDLSPSQFKKAVLRLKKKDLIACKEPRTCPRFYQVTPKLLMSIDIGEY